MTCFGVVKSIPFYEYASFSVFILFLILPILQSFVPSNFKFIVIWTQEQWEYFDSCYAFQHFCYANFIEFLCFSHIFFFMLLYTSGHQTRPRKHPDQRSKSLSRPEQYPFYRGRASVGYVAASPRRMLLSCLHKCSGVVFHIQSCLVNQGLVSIVFFFHAISQRRSFLTPARLLGKSAASPGELIFRKGDPPEVGASFCEGDLCGVKPQTMLSMLSISALCFFFFF